MGHSEGNFLDSPSRRIYSHSHTYLVLKISPILEALWSFRPQTFFASQQSTKEPTMSRLKLLSLTLILLVLAGCQVDPNKTPPASSNASNASSDGKIAITTSSEEARKEFLAGRDLTEKLRLTDSIQHFDKAIALDPNFALAHL